MKKRIISVLDKLIYFSIIIFPFSMAIAPAPMNVFMGLLIGSFLIKKMIEPRSPFSRTAINLPLFFLFLITCLSLINSVDLADSLKGGVFKLLRYILIFFVVSQEVRDKRHLERIIFSLSLALALVSIDSIWQTFSGKDFIRGYSPVVNIGIVRATASFKDSNTLGIYLSCLFPILFGVAVYHFKSRLRIILLAVTILSLAGIILTYSRPTLLAVFSAWVFFAVAKKDKFLSLALIGALLITPFVLPASFKAWVRLMEYNPLRVMCNDDRIAIYRNSINMIKDHPIIGVGANTFMKNYKYYKESPEYRGIITTDYVYAHNNFLHMAGEIGLLGLGVFLWLLFRLFHATSKIRESLNHNFLKVFSLSATAALIAFLVNGLTESSLYSSRVAGLFWYITGLSFSLGPWFKNNDN